MNTFHDSRAVLALSALLSSYGVYKVIRLVYEDWTSPLRLLPRPASPSFIFGNMKEIMAAEAAEMQQIWVKEYGSTFTYKGFLGKTQLYTIDTKAVQHVLTNYMSYPKPEVVRYRLSMLVGNGLVIVEGDKHKWQRQIMNPAFSVGQIRDMTDIFIQKSLQFRDILLAESAKGGGEARFEAVSWLSKVTLDIIGLAGFNYSFNALDSEAEENALIKAFSAALHSGKKGGIIPTIRMMFPSLRWLPSSTDSETKNPAITMREIGLQLIQDCKTSLSAGAQGKQSQKDLLSLLIQANLDAHSPSEK